MEDATVNALSQAPCRTIPAALPHPRLYWVCALSGGTGRRPPVPRRRTTVRYGRLAVARAG
jgi:hypothetical protein